FLLLSIANAWAQRITVDDAWIRSIPPSATTTAAFMIIHNTDSDDAVLISADCDIAETAQIHTMEQVGEIMKMKEVSELRIPANGQAVLAPKGYHIMLIGLVRPIQQGETIPLSLNFSGRATVAVDAVVKKWASMAPMSHH
ncbi:MAG: copper chaperone PCu(A)C, partial [Desulfuromonadales bacterium]